MTARLAEVLDWITRSADPTERAKLARYGIPDSNAAGIPMRDMSAKAKALGRDTDLARALWQTGGYEARTIAAMVADPAALSPRDMDAWAMDFDSWAICDTVCFRLFDRSPEAWGRLDAWRANPATYVRRASWATLWALALHDKHADPELFLTALAKLEAMPPETEIIVEKAQVMAIGAIARRSDVLRAAIHEFGRRCSGIPARKRIARAALKV